MSDYRIYEARAAIAELPGKTHRPWKDGDAREHCSHCRLCGECYPTRVVIEHEKECTDALLSALQALSWHRSRSQGPADPPAPTETETGPESLADYELWLERKRAAQTAGPFDPRTMLAADNFLAEPAPTETGPVFETASPCNCTAQLYSSRDHAASCPMAETAPQGAPDPRLADALANPPGPRHARLIDPIESGRPGKVVITNAPQGAPPMLCLAKSKECGGRPCMLPMGHEGNHANWDCDPVER